MPPRTTGPTYPRTHPWISFELKLGRADPRLWLALGEAASKCEHLAGVPLKPSIAVILHEVNLARGALATAAIEGNTLSEREALAIVQKKSDLPKSQAYLQKEIENIVEAANAIMAAIENDGPSPLTPNDIKNFNRQVLNGLEVAAYVVPGECVRTNIGVPGYRGAPWQECEMLLCKLCDWLNADFKERDGDKFVIGIIKAIVAHLYLVWIHPFGDGNGRTARLLEVRLLTEAGIPSAAGHLLSNFYSRTRTEYYRRLEEASKVEDGVLKFVAYAVRGFVDELRQQLKFVKAQQWGISWMNYVYEQFEGKSSTTDKRRRDLAIEISKQEKPIARSEIRKLSPEIAAQYASLADKTLSRDLAALEEMNLINAGAKGYEPNSSIILAFLPRARKGSIEAQMKEITYLGEEIDGKLVLQIEREPK